MSSTASRNARAPSVSAVGMPWASVGSSAATVALVRPDHAVEQTVEEGADGRIVLLEHLSLHAEEQHEVVAQALGDLDLRVGLDSLGGVRRAQMTVEGKGCSAFEIGHDASCSWKMRQRDGVNVSFRLVRFLPRHYTRSGTTRDRL